MMKSEIDYACLAAAGRNPNTIRNRKLLKAGCGNAGANSTPSLAVLGITTACVDLDTVEAKNLPHSPFLDATPRADGSMPFKAQQLAEACAAHSKRPGQKVYWAPRAIQSIPYGALRQFDGFEIGIDDAPSRSWAIRAAAQLGIPSIVAGLYPPTGNFVATANRSADAPCYFCLRPDEPMSRASCSLYSSSSAVVNPALQTAAAITMNWAIEAMIRFWHQDFFYDGKILRLDLDEGCSNISGFRAHPDCPGPHQFLPEPIEAPFGFDSTPSDVLHLAACEGMSHPTIVLPSPFVLSMPCRKCGTAIDVDRPDWMLRTAPTCNGTCQNKSVRAGTIIESRIRPKSALATRTFASLGLGPLAYVVIEDEAGDTIRVYELPGKLEDIFNVVTLARE